MMSPDPISITGSRLRLRELRASDVAAIHDYAQRPDAVRFQPWGPNSEDDTRAFLVNAIESRSAVPLTRIALAVESKESGQLVGMVELKVDEPHPTRGEISYIIHPDFWNQGCATEAARLMVGFGFRELKLERIQGTCDPRNAASAAVLRKIGMKYERTIPRTHLLRDGWRDSDLYSLEVSAWIRSQV